MKSISQTEKLVLLGLVANPNLPDNEISAKLSLPNSTFASAKSRIHDMGYLDEIYLPIFPRLGLELLATVYSDFNPSVKVEDRVKYTSKAIEVYPELVLSLGESHRGFSISIAPNVTRIMTISNERNKLFAEKGLIETKLPWEVLFPFKLSNIHRFFNLAPLLLSKFTRDGSGIQKILTCSVLAHITVVEGQRYRCSSIISPSRYLVRSKGSAHQHDQQYCWC